MVGREEKCCLAGARGPENGGASGCPVWLYPCPGTPEITLSALRPRDTENKEFVFSFLLSSSLLFGAPKAVRCFWGRLETAS